MTGNTGGRARTGTTRPANKIEANGRSDEGSELLHVISVRDLSGQDNNACIHTFFMRARINE